MLLACYRDDSIAFSQWIETLESPGLFGIQLNSGVLSNVLAEEAHGHCTPSKKNSCYFTLLRPMDHILCPMISFCPSLVTSFQAVFCGSLLSGDLKHFFAGCPLPCQAKFGTPMHNPIIHVVVCTGLPVHNSLVILSSWGQSNQWWQGIPQEAFPVMNKLL